MPEVMVAEHEGELYVWVKNGDDWDQAIIAVDLREYSVTLDFHFDWDEPHGESPI